MSLKPRGVPVLAAALLLAGCGGSAPQNPPAAKPAAPATQAAAPAQAQPPAAGFTEFGVPTCDEYVAKYTECVDLKAPESARAALRQALEESKGQLQQVASTPAGREGLSVACNQALEAAKKAMQPYGCTW
jgi:hypothetical protein